LTDIWAIALISIPTMIFLGLRHAIDVDHITAIDNLVRLHTTSKRARWVGAGFSAGHMLSILAEMIFIVFLVGTVNGTQGIEIVSGIVGTFALGLIGAINIISMKRWGKSGSAILAGKVLSKTGTIGPLGSSLVTGMVFGLGFDTATQISAIAISAIASATAGINVALILVGIFAIGMISVDTLDSVMLRSVFSRIFKKQSFRNMSYALSGVALSVAAFSTYENVSGINVIPDWFGAALAGGVIVSSLTFSLVSN
jgi:nickel/cobalt transporter (NiCoT) family protein